MVEPIIENTFDLKNALQRISFVNTVLDFKWKFEFKQATLNHEQAWLLWVSFERPDILTGVIGRGRGREEIVRKGATISSVIKTAWLLVELMVRHELMEGFRFDGVRIFNPHNSVLDLATLQTGASLSV